MIRAVLFDFDGVLTTHPSGSFTTVAYLSETLGLDADAIWDAFAPFNHDLLIGRTTHAAIWPTICARLGRDVGIDVLHAAFDATPMNRPMVALARRLSAKVRLGIVTDNKQDRVERLVAAWHLSPLFDPIVVSSTVGSDKRDARIFGYALRSLDAAAENVVFIDNTVRNLDAPAAIGIHTVHFDDGANDVDALARLLHSRFGLGEFSDADAVSSASV